MPSIPPKSLRISVDRGGTFTDVYASWPDPDSGRRNEIILKLLSQDPKNYKDAPREGVRRVLEKVTGRKWDREEKLGVEEIDFIRLSTTVATNALLERKGAKHALVITKGFRDLLLIGNQSRPRIFDLAIRKPDVLYSSVLEVDERVTLVGYTSDPQRSEREVQFDEQGKVAREYKGDLPGEGEVARGLSGEAVQVLKKPDVKKIEEDLQKLYDDGVRVLAVVLLHSYTYPEHELAIQEVAERIGFTHISLSSQCTPGMIKLVSRGVSATADAYLTPILREYIDGFFSGFEEGLRTQTEEVEEGKAEGGGEKNTRVEFMMSDGGLTDVNKFSGLKSILSGPAGGVVGYALTGYDEEEKTPIIGLDMGGTSTDVSRYDGRYEIVFETTTAGVTVQSPQLDINTVAAGGGSRLFWRNGLFTTGPESAGSHPGPSCYRKGGPLAVTDANLVLGRLDAEFFPKIFGDKENEGLDIEASKKGLEELRKDINTETGKNMSVDEVAWGFVTVANETMCRPIRALTEARGYSTAKHILSSFGGAGGQHACSIADALGIKTVLVHKFSSVLSAYGMALADRVFEKQEPSSEIYSEESKPRIQSRIDHLSKQVERELGRQGFKEERIATEIYLNLRYEGTDTALMTLAPRDDDFVKEFEKVYKQEFGFVLEGKPIVVDDVRVRGIGHSFDKLPPTLSASSRSKKFYTLSADELSKRRRKTVSVYFAKGRKNDTPVFLLDDLKEGMELDGPLLLIDDTQTIVLEHEWKAFVLQDGLVLKKVSEET
ncbi:5-oxoprolinase [Atractiella rhizophila]|nr:5-oxoprolinase [Atractiella rhizophila]